MAKENIHPVDEVESTLGEKWDRLEFTYHLISSYIDHLKEKGFKSVVVIHIINGVTFDTNTYDINQVTYDSQFIIPDETKRKHSMRKGDTIITRVVGI